MVYIKKVIVSQKDLASTVSKLLEWRGPKTGRGFAMITVYLAVHPKHAQAGLATDKVLIIAREVRIVQKRDKRE